MISDEVAIDLYMLGTFMENRIGDHMDGSFVVTKKKNRKRRIVTKVM